MSELEEKKTEETGRKMATVIERETRRKISAREETDRSIWFGMGMFGIIGWSVAIPTLLGTAVGVWIDRNWPSSYSWTLMLLFLGLILGCLNAWHWVNKESRKK